MSTNAAIARPEGDSWWGRYVHWDGYPTATGIALWLGYHDFATEGLNLDDMRRRLIDEEPVGWSSIYDALLTCDPVPSREQGPGPISYTARGETCDREGGDVVTPECATEWVYVLTDLGLAVYAHGELRTTVAWTVSEIYARAALAAIEADVYGR